MTRNLQEHILQTASGLFYAHGIKATGIDTIVKASGIAKMSLYKYFPSKDDLVVAHLRRSKETILSHINNGISGEDKSAVQTLLAVFDVFAEILSSPEFRGCPFINASAEFAEVGSPIQMAVADFSICLHNLLAGLAKQAGIVDAQQLARQLSMLLTGAIVSEQMQKQPDTMRTAYKAAKLLIEQQLTGAS